MPFKTPACCLVMHRGICVAQQLGELLPKYFARNIRNEFTAELLLGLTAVIAQVAPRVLSKLRPRRLENPPKYKTGPPLTRLARPRHTAPPNAPPPHVRDALFLAACS